MTPDDSDFTMGFASGSVSFRRFAVIGKHPKSITEDHIAKLSDLALRPSDIGAPEEVEYGWSGGRHIYDANFSFERNVFGDALSFALRVDTNADQLLIEPGIPGDGTAADIKTVRIDILK